MNLRGQLRKIKYYNLLYLKPICFLKEREFKQESFISTDVVETWSYIFTACDWPTFRSWFFELSNHIRLYGFGLWKHAIRRIHISLKISIGESINSSVRLLTIIKISASCLNQQSPRLRRVPRRPSLRPPLKEVRSAERPGRRATLSTSTKWWSRFILIPGSLLRRWGSWTLSSTTSSSVSPVNRLVLLTTTSTPPSHRERSRPPCICCCPGIWSNTPCLRAPRLWPNTPAQSKAPLRLPETQRLF